MTNRIDAIVTQGRGRIAYNIVRSLGRRGVRVCVGTDALSGMAVFSRYVAATFRHPPFVDKPTEFIRTLREAIQRHSPAVYLPSGEEAYVVARHMESFQDLDVKIPIAPFETLRRLHLKHESCRLASSLGISAPRTTVPRTFSEVVAFAEQVGEPVVLKKLSSSSAEGTYFLTGNEIATFSQWLSQRDLRFGAFLLQEYVEGDGYGVSMLFNQGVLRARFTHKRLHEISSRGGISTQRMSVVHEELEDAAERLLREVRYHGVAMVEFKYNESTRQAWFIEVNPRFWGSVALPIRSGVDFPHMLYRLALDGDVEPVLTYRLGVNVQWILGDLFRTARDLLTNPRFRYGAKRSRPVNGYDDLYLDDPLPFLAEVVLAARKQLVSRRIQAGNDVMMDRL